MIRLFIFILAGCLFCPAANAQVSNNAKRTFFVVRHAEKDTGSNPAISLAGQKRAGDLFRKLKEERIDLILVSQYRRTGMTADSVRMYKQVDTLHYAADATGESISKILAALPAKYKQILIVGHSNTVPAIIRTLGATEYTVKELPDNEYDNFFTVQQFEEKSTVKAEKFGEVSLPVTAPVKMNISQ